MFSGYKPISAGIRELGQSQALGAACKAAGDKIAGTANSIDPQGAYRAEQATVPSGWSNEPRAGARVVQTRSSRGARLRPLMRAIGS